MVRTFGEITGSIGEGPNFIAPWQTVQVENVQTRKAEFRNPTQGVRDDERVALGRIEAASFETQDVFYDVVLNYSIDTAHVEDLFRAVGPDWFRILVPNRVQQVFKAEVVRYLAIEATQKREEIREAGDRRAAPRARPLRRAYRVAADREHQLPARVLGRHRAQAGRDPGRPPRAGDHRSAHRPGRQGQNEETAKGEAAREIAIASGNAAVDSCCAPTLKPRRTARWRRASRLRSCSTRHSTNRRRQHRARPRRRHHPHRSHRHPAPPGAVAIRTAARAARSMPVHASGERLRLPASVSRPSRGDPTPCSSPATANPNRPQTLAERIARLAAAGAIEDDDYSRGGSVARLEAAWAALLGKEAAVWLPTGTLANHLAVRRFCAAAPRTAPRVIVPAESHLFQDEGDALQRLSSIAVVPLAAGRPVHGQELRAALDAAERRRVLSPAGVVVLESPVRRRVGRSSPSRRCGDRRSRRARGIATHLDGARLFMMWAATGVPVRPTPPSSIPSTSRSASTWARPSAQSSPGPPR